MRAADVVIAQGGPGGIMDSRACGRVPIVVPRDPARGEHVDDHQQRFAAHLLRRGKVAVAADEADLRILVRRAIDVPEEFSAPEQESPTAATGVAIEASVEALLRRSRGRSRERGRVLRLPRPRAARGQRTAAVDQPA
jgi:UDP-N-acetylglucosamine:LPS N-acetylglucosamine transferase